MLSFEHFSGLIAAIHDAVVAPEHWGSVLQQVTRATRAELGGLVVEGIGAPGIVRTTGADPASLASYDAYYRRIDPVIPSMIHRPVGSVLTQEMVITPSDMQRTEFHNDWLRPQGIQGCLAAIIRAGDKPGLIVLAASTRQGGFDADSVRVVQLLTPHLQTAMRTHLKLRGLTLQRDSALDALDRIGRGALYVDANGRVLLANRTGTQLLRAADGLSDTGGAGLRAASADRTAALRRLLASATGLNGEPPSAGSMSLDRPSGARPLMVTAMPFPHRSLSRQGVSDVAALILVAVPQQDGAAPPVALQTLFGLTTAEARVAHLVAQGRTVRTTAAALGIAASTVRTHLLQVFQKTGTNRQAELVHLLGQIMGDEF